MMLVAFAVSSFLQSHEAPVASAQQLDNSTVVQHIDAAVKSRIDNISQYTVMEHYAVFRNDDENHPVAEMTVKTLYKKESGKSYTILSQTGSEMIRNLVLNAILDNEKRLNQPGTREGSWITSANYDMKLKQPATALLDGRPCLVLTLTPKRKAPFLVDGTLWVDAKDYMIVQLQGTGSKSPSMFTGPTQMFRQYTDLDGYGEATHARAVSNSFIFGKTIVKIDYSDYQIQLRPAQ
jgi:hypothetical protein